MTRRSTAKVMEIRQPIAPVVPTMAALAVVHLDEASRRATLLLGETEIEAALDPSVDAVVVVGAIARHERVIAQQEGGAWIVLGALRTSATPGIDPGDEYVIEARRVEVRGAHGVRVESGASRVTLHPYGHIETLAETITTHARGVQRIIGRLLRLN
jgi:hypothetical protein